MVEVKRVKSDSSAQPWRPNKEALLRAREKTVPDLLAPGLRVLFVGINPGLYSAAVEHHFARPGNRFWPALFQSGFSTRQLSPFEERELLTAGYGITNVVRRATARADELSPEEFVAGARQLEKKIRRYQPRLVAFLGLGAYRHGFNRPRAVIGAQPETIGSAKLWVLPNPSGLNANYQLPALVRLFRAVRIAAEE